MTVATANPGTEPAWLQGALAGQRASLARAITAVEENTVDAARVLQAIYPLVGRALVVGFTGAPGAGKSTLVAACITEARRRGLKVGVVAIDPSSPLTGGAVLGDRIRMLSIASDSEVYVRSLAARGHLGGLSAAASRVVDVLDAAGKDLIIIETVGVGQSETEVSGLAHVTVLVCAPGMGDDVQMIKAGVLETADVYAVNKADLPEAHGVIRQLQAASHLAAGAAPAVVATIATTGEGAAELLDAVRQASAARALPHGQERLRRLRKTLETMAAMELERRLQSMDAAAVGLVCQSVLDGRCDFPHAVRQLLGRAITDPQENT
ncbi:MAG: meaB [Ramlibacter sp.]|nr:meaB [Ramlibacter sp.]